MNLIERLGGYERAKAFLNTTSYTMDELIMMQRSGVRPQHVEKALLEYRRQHNIFEVGDKVVFSNTCALNHSIWQVIKSNGDFVVAPICKHNGRVVVESNTLVQYPYSIQHATDEEIAAGKRLEVK